MSHSWLLSSTRPAAGLLLGPASSPERYELVEELHGQHHPVIEQKYAPEVWMAKEKQYVPKLWTVAGHSRSQTGGTPFRPSTHPGQAHCVRILHSFALPVEPGKAITESHRWWNMWSCAMALELLGPSLADWQKARASLFFPSPLVRRLVKQLLLAVDYLHTGLGQDAIGHSSISLDNLLLRECYTQDELKEDKPAASPFLKLVGFNFSLFIHDTGNGWYTEPGDWKAASAEQRLLSKAMYNESPVPPVDIWAVGQVTSLLMFGKNLAFDCGSEGQFSDATVPAQLKIWGSPPHKVVALASLDPEAGWPAFLSEANDQDCDPDYPFNLPGVEPVATLQERIEAQGKVTDPDEVKQLTTFLQACWTLDPFKRAAAKDLLKHEWLRGVE
ncbi:hypothetical protein JCM8547_008987 [Rhodosporidiobolus lusitaniae]